MKKLLEKAKSYFDEIKTEMTKVSWPSRENLKDSTLVVLVVTLFFSIITGAVDRLLSWGVQQLYRLIG
ncbi:MAG: preprotein translocase subunit SecE [candidate division KSB1 bacterium]|nr:preprotein translocase subunit SecE [candidate division KSB1 bacterium]MDZ7272545.1 preprotein translocase subunit SecE [candidate division KSB1 bacterium]MDZ7284431.1 preprotein translocase subunit SecE [candidate division KSB1 bacterium]MDZ7297173.1 preprotein translocase subunit SecE [candidate division KSB1 bacterium]MDZ7306688.1 preprotein translocase subunit SecE [candidate division KSB1 bacterium]